MKPLQKKRSIGVEGDGVLEGVQGRGGPLDRLAQAGEEGEVQLAA